MKEHWYTERRFNGREYVNVMRSGIMMLGSLIVLIGLVWFVSR